jgi:hypothetical protein
MKEHCRRRQRLQRTAAEHLPLTLRRLGAWLLRRPAALGDRPRLGTDRGKAKQDQDNID